MIELNQPSDYSAVLATVRRDLITNPSSERIRNARELAASAAESCSDVELKTEFYCVLALHFHNYAEFDSSYEWLNKARACAGDNYSAQAWIAYTHAAILMRQRRLREALTVLEPYEKVGEVNNKLVAARLQTLRAGILDSLGETDRADQSYQAALELREAIGDPLGLATVYYNYAEFCMRRDDDARALEYFSKCYNIERDYRNMSGLAQSASHLAQLHARRGNRDEALRYFEESTAAAIESAVQMVIAIVKSNAASIFESLGDKTAQISSLLDAKTYLERYPFESIRSKVLGNLGQMYVSQQEYEKAEPLLNEALSISEMEGDRYACGHWLLVLGRMYNDQGKYKEAISVLTKARDYLAAVQAHVDTLRAFSELARAQAGVGATREAYELMSAWASAYTQQHADSMETRMRRLQAAREKDRKEKEDEIQRLRNVELVAANEKLTRMNKELSELATEKDEFMAIAAHDLRNPLADMRTMLQSIIAHYDVLGRDDVLDVCKELLSAVTRMIATVHAFLEVSRTDRRSNGLSLDKLDIVHMAHRAVERYEARAYSKKINILVKSTGEAWAYADHSIVDAVLDNLISNAIKYSPRDSTITITVFTENKEVAVHVQDAGPGVPAAERAKLFTKYARLSARPTGGEDSIGLGLYLVKRMAQRMNATIEYVDHDGPGAIFALKMPSA